MVYDTKIFMLIGYQYDIDDKIIIDHSFTYKRHSRCNSVNKWWVSFNGRRIHKLLNLSLNAQVPMIIYVN